VWIQLRKKLLGGFALWRKQDWQHCHELFGAWNYVMRYTSALRQALKRQRSVGNWNRRNFFHTFTQLQYFLFRNNKLPSGPASVERVRHFSSIVNIFLKWIFNKVKKLYTLYFHSNLNVWYTTGCVLSTKREHFLYFHNYKPTKAFERRVSSNSQFLMLVIKI